MPLQPPRITRLPPELLSEAAELLRKNTRQSRLRAAQLLAHGYERDERRRRADLGEYEEDGEE